MRITITLDLDPSEIDKARPLIEQLQELSAEPSTELTTSWRRPVPKGAYHTILSEVGSTPVEELAQRINKLLKKANSEVETK